MRKTFSPITWENIKRIIKGEINKIPTPEPSVVYVELTLAELETTIAADEVQFGAHYIVTDKDWLLTGIANNKLVDFAGQGITIMNGDTLPTGVEPKILYIDTGESNDEVIVINTIETYAIQSVFIKNITAPISSETTLVYDEEAILKLITVGNIVTYSHVIGVVYDQIGISVPVGGSFLLQQQVSNVYNIRAILKFEKSQV